MKFYERQNVKFALRIIAMMIIDAVFISAALWLALVFRNYDSVLDIFKLKNFLGYPMWILACAVIISWVLIAVARGYNQSWRYASFTSYASVAIAEAAAMILTRFATNAMDKWFGGTHLSFMQAALAALFAALFLVMWRMAGGYYVKHHSFFSSTPAKRVMIIGAGDTGSALINSMNVSGDAKPVIVIDDSPNRQGLRVGGVLVYGGREKIVEAAKKFSCEEIIIAIPSADRESTLEIVSECAKTGLKVNTVPSLYELSTGAASAVQVHEVDVADLLGRNQLLINNEDIMGYIKGEVVMVTGGGGSIGSELCRQIAKFSPKLLIVFDIYENNAYELQNELLRLHPNDLNMVVLIGSVRDRARLEEIFETLHPTVIFHAAAHKHVPLMEDSPNEAIKNNVYGTYNVASCADKYGAKRFVMISTDKAVNPTNVMGASKRFAEMVIQQISRRAKNTVYACVRFGNVLGSNGSVIPLFKQQIRAGGPVTVTHPEINRFFMTIPEAAQLVIHAGALASGGEIFILDMGKPVKIVDLARNLIRLSGYEPDVDIKIEFTGLRPGEKMYEELLLDKQKQAATKNEKIFIEPPITDVKQLIAEMQTLNQRLSCECTLFDDMVEWFKKEFE